MRTAYSFSNQTHAKSLNFVKLLNHKKTINMTFTIITLKRQQKFLKTIVTIKILRNIVKEMNTVLIYWHININ